MIDSRQASEALDDINEIARRVRQSTIYNLSSLMLIMWGALVFAGNIASFLWPRQGGYIWLALNAVGIVGSFAISAYSYPKPHPHLRYPDVSRFLLVSHLASFAACSAISRRAR